MHKVIIDSDWGGDVLQLTSILAARSDQYEILGATVTFGNASLAQNVLNAGAMLKLMHLDEQVPYFAGAVAPSGQNSPPEGDCAHGKTGLGNAVVQHSTVPPANQHAVDFILEQVEKAPEKAITLIATAPLTNIANAIRQAPVLMAKLKEIRIMGGCVQPLNGYRVDAQNNRLSENIIERYGNITEHAEFNFQQAPHDAATVMGSSIPLALFPMDCTHQMTLTPSRQAKLKSVFATRPDLCKQLLDLMTGPSHIDERKFGIDSTLHDAHTTLSMVSPRLYTGTRGVISVSVAPDEPYHGRSTLIKKANGPHWIAGKITNPEEAYDHLLDAMRHVLVKI